MTCFQSVLVGNTKKALKYPLTELEEQFGNKKLVAGAFMKTVVDHPIAVEGDTIQLRSLYNTLHSAITKMKGL